MTLVRLLLLVGALALVAFVAKLSLGQNASHDSATVSEPKRELDDVRERARAIEAAQDRSAQRADVAP